MANRFFPKGKQAILNKEIDFDTDTIKAILVSQSYTHSDAYQFLSDVSAHRVAGTTDQALTAKSITLGVFDAADPKWLAVPSGDVAEAVILYRDSGAAATSQLISIHDTITNFPVTTNGGDIEVLWDSGANKIFSL